MTVSLLLILMTVNGKNEHEILGFYHTALCGVVSDLIFKARRQASLTQGMCYLGVNQAVYEQYFDSGEITHTSFNVTLQ